MGLLRGTGKKRWPIADRHVPTNAPTYLKLLNREFKHDVYAWRQTWICTTWQSSFFTCRLLFIISTHKLVVSRNFLSISIVWAVFICSFFCFEKFSTWNWRYRAIIYFPPALTVHILGPRMRSHCQFSHFLRLICVQWTEKESVEVLSRCFSFLSKYINSLFLFFSAFWENSSWSKHGNQWKQ